ncbi:hypothetical protein SmJEL517_g00798 [Synchytrium microbalum]|uniref:Fork-head domain-containing protein n=1 Tax=Synchytrium microbalum TaxID=1806994 RepID=A0A507CCE5_9FUNG|nr:uncharacterized protein SmJEL517_g00798 [Synchytrium microbalum]TPX37171.1 hypothetical protein SmJEL517_g00798 [Synchytrium microbalum]
MAYNAGNTLQQDAQQQQQRQQSGDSTTDTIANMSLIGYNTRPTPSSDSTTSTIPSPSQQLGHPVPSLLSDMDMMDRASNDAARFRNAGGATQQFNPRWDSNTSNMEGDSISMSSSETSSSVTLANARGGSLMSPSYSGNSPSYFQPYSSSRSTTSSTSPGLYSTSQDGGMLTLRTLPSPLPALSSVVMASSFPSGFGSGSSFPFGAALPQSQQQQQQNNGASVQQAMSGLSVQQQQQQSYGSDLLRNSSPYPTQLPLPSSQSSFTQYSPSPQPQPQPPQQSISQQQQQQMQMQQQQQQQMIQQQQQMQQQQQQMIQQQQQFQQQQQQQIQQQQQFQQQQQPQQPQPQQQYLPPRLQTSVPPDQQQQQNATGSPIMSSSSPTTARVHSNSSSRRSSRGAPASKFDTTNFSFGTDQQGKPQQSYATIITYALQTATGGQMTLNDIYEWVMHYYPYFRTAGAGWKNSIRHNLSLNRAFVRVPRPPNEGGKGAYWTLDADYTTSGIGSPLRKPRSVSDPPFGGRTRASTDPPLPYRDPRDPTAGNNNNGEDGGGGDSYSSTNSAPSTRRVSAQPFADHMFTQSSSQSMMMSSGGGDSPLSSHRMSITSPDTAVEPDQRNITQLMPQQVDMLPSSASWVAPIIRNISSGGVVPTPTQPYITLPQPQLQMQQQQQQLSTSSISSSSSSSGSIFPSLAPPASIFTSSQPFGMMPGPSLPVAMYTMQPQQPQQQYGSPGLDQSVFRNRSASQPPLGATFGRVDSPTNVGGSPQSSSLVYNLVQGPSPSSSSNNNVRRASTPEWGQPPSQQQQQPGYSIRPAPPSSPQYRASGLSNVLATAATTNEYDGQQQQQGFPYDDNRPSTTSSSNDDDGGMNVNSSSNSGGGTLGLWNVRTTQQTQSYTSLVVNSVGGSGESQLGPSSSPSAGQNQ